MARVPCTSLNVAIRRHTLAKATLAKPRATVASEDGFDTMKPSGTVHRTIRLIAVLAGSKDEVSVSDVAAKLMLPIPTVHRLLHLLRDAGVVEWNSKSHRYLIGPELYRISAQVGSSRKIQDIARREIAHLTEQTGETVLFALYQPAAAAMSFEERAEGSHPLQYRIQMHVPLSLVWGASGKSILAFLPSGVAKVALERETDDAKNGKPPPSLAVLEAELGRIRKSGYCVSEGEKLAGARGVAAPVYGVNGVLGSICMTSPAERVPINRIAEFAEMVRESANRLSRSLGHTPE